MSDILEEFDIFSKVRPELKREIKIFHVFDDNKLFDKQFNVLFITSDDKVFGFGSNGFGCCGLGHNSVVNEPQVIPELCHKNINQFIIGWDFVLALSSDQQLYGWGHNMWGQLARGYGKYLRPEVIIIPNETIIEVSCGSEHTLVLTLNGNVYGWGWNRNGQIGCGEYMGEIISKPFLLETFKDVTIKSVYCSHCRSYALTTDGLVYTWGGNNFLYWDKKVFEPKLMDISNVKSVVSSKLNTYFLTNEGLLYFCGYYVDEDSCELYKEWEDGYIGYWTDAHIDALMSVDEPRIIKTDIKFSSLYSVYCNNRTIVSTLSEESVYYLHYNRMKKIKRKTYFDYYCEEYKITYKTIEIQNNLSIDCNDFLNFYKIETKINEKSNKSTNLKSIIKQKREYFGRQPNEAMNTIEYFISCQMFEELLDSVNSLHESNPPIIHGNLRPENILISEQQTNGWFLKIDSNLINDSKNGSIDKSLTKEEMKYISPESNFLESCNTKTDIYCLAVIAMDLFDYNIFENKSVTNNEKLKNHWTELKTLITSMMNMEFEKRPNCSVIITSSENWSISPQQLCYFGATDCLNDTKDENNFFQTYFNTCLMNEVLNCYSIDSSHRMKSDVVFIVSEEQIPSNKLLLRIKNKVFKEIFSQSNDMRIIVKDLNPMAFRSMLKYIYSNKISFETTEQRLQMFIDVYKCAERYKVTPLMEKMKSEINSLIEFNTIEIIYGLAKEFDLGDLKSSAEKFLTDNFEESLTLSGDQLIRINEVTDNYLFRLLMNYSSDQKNKNELLMNFLRPSGSDSVVVDQLKLTKVKPAMIDECDPRYFGVFYENKSTDLSEEKQSEKQ